MLRRGGSSALNSLTGIGLVARSGSGTPAAYTAALGASSSSSSLQGECAHANGCLCTSCCAGNGNPRRGISTAAAADVLSAPRRSRSRAVGHGHGLSCPCDSCAETNSRVSSKRGISSAADSGNRGVVFMAAGEVEVKPIDFPKLELDSMSSPVPSERQKRKCEHGVILKVTTTNICGSDQHMVRGRTSLTGGYMVLGHEITGEVIECGKDVEYIKEGDLCSVPFNIACGRCVMCKAGHTGVCLNVNPGRAGAAYGYVDMGGWIGGQSEYVMVPYADFNLLKFPDKDQALEKIKHLTLLSDIFPTGYHGAVSAGVGPGKIAYVAGAGPVGLACAASCQLLGAAVVIVGDMIPERLEQAKSFGCEVVDIKKGPVKDQIAEILGTPEVDCAIDCVGFEARGCGHNHGTEKPAQVLNDCMEITKAAGGIGIPGLYVTEDPGGVDDNARTGSLAMRLGLGWSKSQHFVTGQCPVMRYHRDLMNAILYDKIDIAGAVNAKVISLEEAPAGYKDFDKGAAVKYVIDPHGTTMKH
ncbi:glutathione-independent formaldehyde dehydrogenase [Pseudoscourfieldia marina]